MSEPMANYFNAARESRTRRQLRKPSSPSAPSSLSPYPDDPSPTTKALFDLDDIHTEVNEEAKVAVRTYRSGVDCEVEAELRNEAQSKLHEARSEGEAMAISRAPAQNPLPTSTTPKKHKRISPAQEIELATIIQKGVSLFKVQQRLTEENQREPTNKEWAKAASLTSSQLRRSIASYREAKSALVASNLGLVHAVVKNNKNYRSQRTYEELVQEGSLGLLRAAELFDPARGLRFSTYATIWIKGVLSNLQGNSLINIPARERSKWNKIRRAANEFSERNGREPSASELSELTGMDASAIKSVTSSFVRAKFTKSLDNADYHGYNALHYDASMTQSCMVDELQMKADVVSMLAENLDERERRLLRLRYGLNDGKSRSLSECAEAMGLSKERVRKLNLQCLEKLREAKESANLEEYLLTIL